MLPGVLVPRRPFLLSWLFFTALGCLWALATPLMAVPDEPAHTVYAAAAVRGEVWSRPRATGRRSPCGPGWRGRTRWARASCTARRTSPTAPWSTSREWSRPTRRPGAIPRLLLLRGAAHAGHRRRGRGLPDADPHGSPGRRPAGRRLQQRAESGTPGPPDRRLRARDDTDAVLLRGCGEPAGPGDRRGDLPVGLRGGPPARMAGRTRTWCPPGPIRTAGGSWRQ